jgi:ESS family glutamate:Na+ symporter
MLTIEVNKYLTLAIAVGVLMLGQFLRKKIRFLETFCIPAPVVGGLIVAIISCILYVSGVVEFVYDDTFREICMVFFFTSVGFQANLAVLKEGGKDLIVFLIQVIVLIVLQNVLAVGVSRLLGVNPLVGMCTGSVPMVGGHGTAGAFGPVIEDFGIEGATTIATAAATFGLIAGSLIGGPLGNSLIQKFDLLKTAKSAEDVEIFDEDEEQHVRHFDNYAPAVFELCVTVGLGTLVSALLTKTGMTFPVYIGAMIVAAIIRNIGEATGKIKVYMGEINDLGGICLSLFLGIAMITLKIWQLAALALPLVILLLVQLAFMYVFARFVIFRFMGKDYDAAVITAGTCGFGMGATPNAMANMQAI